MPFPTHRAAGMESGRLVDVHLSVTNCDIRRDERWGLEAGRFLRNDGCGTIVETDETPQYRLRVQISEFRNSMSGIRKAGKEESRTWASCFGSVLIREERLPKSPGLRKSGRQIRTLSRFSCLPYAEPHGILNSGSCFGHGLCQLHSAIFARNSDPETRHLNRFRTPRRIHSFDFSTNSARGVSLPFVKTHPCSI